MAEVLIIDDDVSAAAALAALLKREGHAAECACDAGHALTYLRTHEPNLVLLDLDMPCVGGMDLLDALMDEPRFADLRIAIFSGCTDRDAAEKAERLGACDFIPKGNDWGSIQQRIRALLADDAAVT